MLKKILTFIVFLLAFSSSMIFSQTVITERVFDYYFLIDVSGSMMGKPFGSGNTVILPKVKKVINEFIAEIQPPATIYILPFDEGVHDEKTYTVNNNNDIIPAKDYIIGLDANGLNTWIFRSLSTTFDGIDRVKNLTSNQEHISIIYLYTDGIDNDTNNLYTIKTILDKFHAQKGKYDWLYYISLGKALPESMEPFITDPNVTTITAENGVVPPIILINNKISILPYGNLWKTGNGKMTSLFTINGKENMPGGIKVHLEPEFPEMASRGQGIDVTPQNFVPAQTIDLSMRLVNFKKNQKDQIGGYKAIFKLSTNSSTIHIIPDEIIATFDYTPPPPLPVWIKLVIILAGIFIAYIFLVLGYCIITGNDLSPFPWRGQAATKYSLMLETLEPAGNKGEELDLSKIISKKKHVQLGEGTNLYSSAAELLSIDIEKEDETDIAVLTVNKGHVFLVKKSKKDKKEIFIGQIIDGDEIYFGDYKIIMISSSFTQRFENYSGGY